MKIFFNQQLKYTEWGGGSQFLTYLYEFLRKKGHHIIFKLKKNIDLIFIIANFKELDPKIFKYTKKYPNTKVLHRINECDKRKNTSHVDNLVLKANEIADETIFISNWLSEYYIKKGYNRSYHVIYNGCNTNYFYPKHKKELGKKVNLVTHHWSRNWMKGFDIYNKLDKVLNEREDINFTYIGRYWQGYNPINTKLLPPQYGKNLGDELRNYDIYLTASRWEPCGMHHIEGASCGLPVLYHSEGGGINESCKNYGLKYNDIPSLLEGIDKIKESYQEYLSRIPYNFLSSKRCCEEYYKIILNLNE